jgi:hypothetical protein
VKPNKNRLEPGCKKCSKLLLTALADFEKFASHTETTY